MVAIDSTPIQIGTDTVIKYEGGATITLETYTFPAIQETITVFNDSVQRLTVIASGKTYHIAPNVGQLITEDTDTLQIKTEKGYQPFRLEGRVSLLGTKDMYARGEVAKAMSQSAENTAHLNDNSVSVENFPLIAPETDDTGRIQRALNTGRNVLFGQGKTYNAKKITPIGNQSLIGYNSTIRFVDGETGALIDIVNVANIDIIGLTLDGGVTSTFTTSSAKGTRKGISINGSSVKSINIDMCKIKGFDSDGIYLTSLGYQAGHGMAVKVSNTDVIFCYHGINVAFRGEYCHFVNVSCLKSRVGMRVEASNTFATNVHCSDNVDGLHLLLEVGGNDSHSGFTNCSFNHNSNYAIFAKDFKVGISMVGCHVQASGTIVLDNCSGFRFNTGQIRYTNISVNGGGYNAFRDNLVDNVTVTHASGGVVDSTEFINNTGPITTSDVNGYLNTPNYYIDRTVSTGVSGITTEVTVVANNRIDQLLFGQTDTTIYDGTTGIGTIKQRGLYNISSNFAVQNTGASDISVELAIYRGASRVKRSTFLIKAGQIQFIESSLTRIFESNDTWKVTLKANSGSINLLVASEAHLFVQKIS